MNSRRSGRYETDDEIPVIELSRIIELFEGRRPKDKILIDPHKILKDKGLKEVHLFLLNELQRTYKANNIEINDKHFEVIIRKMTGKIKIKDAGDTMFLMGEITERRKFLEENAVVSLEGGKEAVGQPVLLGITKAALSANSWISAASFQETTKILTEAAIEGDVDHLKGLKENVIMGRLIPAGTGHEKYKDTFVKDDFHTGKDKTGTL
ncbi:DNA-directed RNA polymerase subunit beta' [bacterium BMS3Abin06]|nr:DNA-directed RNA polymerase subunit beta' [bacterium BMS3Abin06]